MKQPPRQAPPSRLIELSLALVVVALALAWYFLRSPPPAAPLPPVAPVVPVVAEATPPPPDEPAPTPRSNVLLVNLSAIFSGSKHTQDEQVKMNQMRSDAESARQTLTGDALAAFVQSTQVSMDGEFGSFRSAELNRIIAAIQLYRQAGGFKTVYDSGNNQGQSFGLELLPVGVTGYDGTADILAALNQAPGP